MKFYGQWSPPVDEVIYKNYFVDKIGGIALECGAAEFGESCKFFEETLNWTVYNLEASKYTFRRLRDNRPNSFNLNIGLSDQDGVKEFKDIIAAPGGGHGNGSLGHTPEHLRQLEGYQVVFEEYSIETITYKSFLANIKLKTLDLLVLDVEGHELEVIKGMNNCDVLPQVFVVEYPVVGLELLKESLQSLGYHFNFISFNNAFFSSQDIVKDWFGQTELMYI